MAFDVSMRVLGSASISLCSNRRLSHSALSSSADNQGCDVYSFSIVLWEMLALERPYNNFRDADQFMSKVFERGIRPPLKKSFGEGCKAILRAGWANLDDRSTMETISLKLRKEVINLRHGDDTGLDHTKRRSTFVYENKRGRGMMASCSF